MRLLEGDSISINWIFSNWRVNQASGPVGVEGSALPNTRHEGGGEHDLVVGVQVFEDLGHVAAETPAGHCEKLYAD